MSREEEWAALYAQHAGPAFAFAYHLVGDRPLAEDLLSEAFVRVAGRVSQVRPDAFGAYLRRTIANLATSHWRHRAVEQRHVARTRPEVSYDAAPVDLSEALRTELMRLPDKQRIAVVARYYLDWSDEEIADVLGCRTATVRSLVFRGLAKLRPALADPPVDSTSGAAS